MSKVKNESLCSFYVLVFASLHKVRGYTCMSSLKIYMFITRQHILAQHMLFVPVTTYRIQPVNTDSRSELCQSC